MREKELRLALVCYGGISLAIYMHGITKEIWKLLRASAARDADGVAALADSERVYRDVLDALRPALDLRVMADIVAGASAGGINGILLAQAIASGQDMEPLRELWLTNADVDQLLDPVATARPWSKWWAAPLIAYARGRGGDMVDAIADRMTRREVRAKLSRFMRSRWFAPPFSGLIFTRMLYNALLRMGQAPAGRPLLPPGQPLDLFVTVTDFYGRPEALQLHSPAAIVETEHRLVIGFRRGTDAGPLADPAALAFAARATASFPGAFPPAQVGEIDAVLAEQGRDWPGRAAFLAKLFPHRAASAEPFETATLIDGSVLNNRPFGPAIEALRHRPAHREVDRRFVYVDPHPGMHGARSAGQHPPGFFTTILRSLADIPREQPIRDNLEAIAALSARVRRLRSVLDGMQPQVDAAIERAVGRRFLFYRMTPLRLAAFRSRAQTAAARDAGFAYGAYGQLKLAQVCEGIAARLGSPGSLDAVRAAVRAHGWDDVAAVAGRRGAEAGVVDFLRRFDLDFRIRRLRFLLRRLNVLAVETGSDGRAAVEAAKALLYALLAPYLARRDAGFHVPAPGDGVDAVLARYEAALDLRALDAATDTALAELFLKTAAGPMQRTLLNAYLGFPYYDIAMLPLLQGDGLDEFDEIKVDRISPDDALAIRTGGHAVTLKGTQFNAFGAFFSRAWRENDYLWGRLHGADRLIDIVVSCLPGGAPPPPVAALKARAFRAILAAERPHLTAVGDLFDMLDAEIAVAEAAASG